MHLPRWRTSRPDDWPIIIAKEVEDAAGFHDDEHGQPFALVEFGPEWSLTASHECLEMLADPFGRRLRLATRFHRPLSSVSRSAGSVTWSRCAIPSEAGDFVYQVNGVLVSDFYTPDFFDPVTVSSVRYSFTGAIKAPENGTLKTGTSAGTTRSPATGCSCACFPMTSPPNRRTSSI